MEYKYKGVNTDGKIVSGIINEENQWSAIATLSSQGISCICCESEKEKVDNSFIGKISSKDLALLCRTLKNNMKSGIPITLSLKMATNHIKKKALVVSLKKLNLYIERGDSLTEALNRLGDYFPKVFISMVAIGEETGHLEEIFSKLENYFLREDKRKKSIVNIIIYPTIIFVAAFIGAFIIITKFMPTFFENLNIDKNKVPFITKFYMDISNILINFNYLIIPLVIVLIITLLVTYKKIIESNFIDRFKYKGFITRSIYTKNFICKFTMALQMIISSGIDLKSAFYLLEKSESSNFIRERYINARKSIEKGNLLSDAIRKFELFPEEFFVSILLGEESGDLEAILSCYNEIFEEELKNKIDVFIKLLEPALILLAGIFLLSIYVAILIPIYGIYSN